MGDSANPLTRLGRAIQANRKAASQASVADRRYALDQAIVTLAGHPDLGDDARARGLAALRRAKSRLDATVP